MDDATMLAGDGKVNRGHVMFMPPLNYAEYSLSSLIRESKGIDELGLCPFE